MGHLNNKLALNASEDSGKANVKWFYCKSKGHVIKDCHTRKANKKKVMSLPRRNQIIFGKRDSEVDNEVSASENNDSNPLTRSQSMRLQEHGKDSSNGSVVNTLHIKKIIPCHYQIHMLIQIKIFQNFIL